MNTIDHSNLMREESKKLCDLNYVKLFGVEGLEIDKPLSPGNTSTLEPKSSMAERIST